MERVFDVDLRAALDGMDRRRRRSKQREPGASDLGTCRRRVAYKLAGQPHDNFRSMAKAIQGTLLHRGALAALKTAHGGLTEVRVERPGVLKGSLDWLRFDPLGLPIVDDLKTTGKDNHDGAVRGPISRPHLWQFHAYADMLRKGEISPKEKRVPREPIDVVDIEVLYLCRDDGRCDARRIPFQQSVADEAFAWLAEIGERLVADGVKMVPRDLPGPADSVICRNCPFVRDCWKWDPETEKREPLELAGPEVEQWAHLYSEAQRAEALAAADKKLARAHLEGQPPAQWPSGWALKWNGGQPKWVEEPDTDALVKEFEAAGLMVPTRAVNKARAASISVLPPKPKKAGTTS